jgi:hypothetical protein
VGSVVRLALLSALLLLTGCATWLSMSAEEIEREKAACVARGGAPVVKRRLHGAVEEVRCRHPVLLWWAKQ